MIVQHSTFQESWKNLFEKEKALLTTLTSPLLIDFHHVGSTSIYGCLAKPIIDILGVIDDLESLEDYKNEFYKNSYKVLGELGIKGRRYYSKNEPFLVHLHIFENGHPEIERMLRFRDYLRSNPALVKEYCEIKKELAAQFDRPEYTKRKDPFIKKVTILAANSTTSLHYPLIHEKTHRDWTIDRIIDSMVSNWHLHLTYFSRYIPLFEPIYEESATVVRAFINDDTYNFIANARFDEINIQEQIKQFSNYFEKFNLPYSWWVGPKDSVNLENALKAANFVLKETNLGMYFTIEKPLEFVIPNLVIERIFKKEELKDFADIVVMIGMHPTIYESIYSQIPEILYCEGSPFEYYLAKYDGKAVATGILLFNAHVAGIYYISTHPNYRKKGYATAMMRHLLNRAFEKGYEKSVLQASPEGRFVYQKMGFIECCSFKEYKKKNEHSKNSSF